MPNCYTFVQTNIPTKKMADQLTDATRKELLASKSFKTINGIKTLMDTFLLDPVVGLFSSVGDLLTGVLALPSLYFAFFKVKSVRLTLACLFNTIMDMLVGLVPLLGDVFDFFSRSYKKNVNLIVGYVNNEEEAVRQAKVKSVWAGVLVLVLIAVLYLIFRVFAGFFASLPSVYNYIVGLF